MTVPSFGRQQLRIMQVLWDRGRANARQITDALSEDKDVAHSTVQTLLRQLEGKGAVGHDVAGRTFVFFPTVKAERVCARRTSDFVDHMFAGSPSGLVAYLLKHERISRRELDRIRRLIDEKEQNR